MKKNVSNYNCIILCIYKCTSCCLASMFVVAVIYLSLLGVLLLKFVKLCPILKLFNSICTNVTVIVYTCPKSSHR